MFKVSNWKSFHTISLVIVETCNSGLFDLHKRNQFNIDICCSSLWIGFQQSRTHSDIHMYICMYVPHRFGSPNSAQVVFRRKLNYQNYTIFNFGNIYSDSPRNRLKYTQMYMHIGASKRQEVRCYASSPCRPSVLTAAKTPAKCKHATCHLPLAHNREHNPNNVHRSNW